jgi:YVTN family beta-propeller protein
MVLFAGPAALAASGYTYSVTGTISFQGNSGFYVTVDPDTATAYASDGDNVVAIDESTATVTATIPVNGLVDTVGVDPDTDTIYAGLGNGFLDVISGATDTVTATLFPGASTGIAVDPVTNTIYLADESTVTVISGASDTVTATIGGFSYAIGIAVDPGTGTLFVTDLYADTVTAISVANNTVIATIPVNQDPYAVAVDPATQTAYVTGIVATSPTSASGTVQVISESTDTVTGTISVGTVADAIAVDSGTDTIYVGDEVTNNVSVIDGTTSTQTATIGMNSPVFPGPGGLAVDSVTHTGFALAETNNELTEFSQGTTATTTQVQANPSPVPAGSAFSLVATVSPAPDAGTVGFTLNGSAVSGCGAQPVDPSTGQATCSLTAPDGVGSDTIGAKYSGGDGYDPSSVAAVLTVSPGPAASVTTQAGNNQSANTGQAFGTPLSVVVTDQFGNEIDGATVTFTIQPSTGGTANFGGSTQTATAVTNSAGVATAPTLYAGTTAGPVLVTASSGSGQATFMETVTSTAPARADLAISMSAPGTLAPGASGTVTVTVTNHGPQAAAHVLTLLYVPRGLTITSTGGGTVLGGADVFTAPTLAAGQTLTYKVGVTAGHSAGPLLLLAGTGSATRDPDLLNNITAATLRIT